MRKIGEKQKLVFKKQIVITRKISGNGQMFFKPDETLDGIRA